MNLKQDILNAFVAAVNGHDIEKMGELMSKDHAFVTADQRRFDSQKVALESWKNFFDIFPDYQFDVVEISESTSGLIIIANASGSFRGKKEVAKSFLIPMSVKVGIDANQISEWQVFANPRKIAEIMNYAPARDMSNLGVTGLGGAFFKAKDPKSLCAWYDQHLGTTFKGTQSCYYQWSERVHPETIGSTSFGVFGEKSSYFDPSESQFMFNFRVNNLDGLMAKLKKESVQVIGEVEKYDYGNFGWIVDPEGNKIELWEPVDAVLDAYEQEQGR